MIVGNRKRLQVTLSEGNKGSEAVNTIGLK